MITLSTMPLSFYKLATILGIVIGLSGCSDNGSAHPGDNNTFAPSEDDPVNAADVSGIPPVAAAGVLDDTSFLLTNNEATVYKLSPITGAAQVLYSSDSDFEFSAPADVIGDIAYMTANDNSINALDLNTGEILWDIPIGVYQNPNYSNFPTAVVCDDITCWARGSTGVLMAVDASDGSQRWSTALHPSGGSEEELDGSEMLVTQDRIYLTAHKTGTTLRPDFVDPALYIVNRNDGVIIKKMDLDYSGYGVPRVVGNTLLVSTWGEILAFDVTSYELLWRINDPAFGYTKAQLVGNVVVVGVYNSNDHYIVGFDLASGTQLWSVAAGSSDNAYSSTTDGQLIYAMVGELDTGMYYSPPGEAAMAIDPSNGSVIWTSDHISFAENPLVVFGKAFYGYHWTIYDDYFDSTPDGLTATNAQTGNVEWVNSTLDTPGLDWFTHTPMLVHNGKAYRSSHYPDVMP